MITDDFVQVAEVSGRRVLSHGSWPVTFISEEQAVKRAEALRGYGKQIKAIPTAGSAWWLEVIE